MLGMVGIIGFVASLALLMYLAYRGASVIVLSPLLAILAALCSMPEANIPLMATYTQVFMIALGEFVTKYAPLFILGAIFGLLMEESGSAQAIASSLSQSLGSRYAVLTVVLCCAVLTYGGISLFVVAFAMQPLADALFREANVPRRLIPGAIALGSFTFTMSCLPGTTQIQNLIPMPYFKTTAFAAPGLGIIGGMIILVMGMLWLNRRAGWAAQKGEGYGKELQPKKKEVADRRVPSIWIAVLPLVWVVVANFLASRFWIPTWETAYLAEAKYGSTEISKVYGSWASIMALTSAIVLVIALHFRSFDEVNLLISKSATGALLPVFNTGSEAAYGAVIASLPSFAVVKAYLLGIAPSNPLISEATSVTVLAGISGSASGGMSIALKSLGETYYQRAIAAGIDPELMHRVASMASGGLDTLPHNGAVITLLTICGLTHRQSYLDIAVVSVICPLIATAAVIALGSAVGSF